MLSGEIKMFSREESDLLNVAFETFIDRLHVFDTLSAGKWKDTGIENWVQIEFMIALLDKGYDVSTIGKKKRNCDLIVKDEGGLNVGIEIETITYPQYWQYVFITQGLEKHISPEPDLFLFLGRIDNDGLTKLDEYLRQHNYVEKHDMFAKGWMVMILKKEKITS
jgi:hypothetical protein